MTNVVELRPAPTEQTCQGRCGGNLLRFIGVMESPHRWVYDCPSDGSRLSLTFEGRVFSALWRQS